MDYESWRISFQSSEQAAKTAYKEIESLRTELAEAQGMAECLTILRDDLIKAGMIDEKIAPMFLTEAILAKLAECKQDAERYRFLRGKVFFNKDGCYFAVGIWSELNKHMEVLQTDEAIDQAITNEKG